MNTETPSSLGRYRVVGVLGQGAMGVVYEAIDPQLNRTVAIKTILQAHLLDGDNSSEYLARFNREARAAGRLNHPNIVTLFDFGTQDGMTYMVMEFVRGRELAKAFAQREPFTLSEVVRIMGELLDALAYAHAQGVVHRDVKPANVLIDELGRVKLTDFGVARVAESKLDRTMPGTMVGTPSYMSPEQIQGLAVGSRTDIFAAGIVLYQFLTGQRPFAGGGAFAIQRKIVQDEPVLPSVANPSLPKRFDAVVMRALAKSPADRFESAEVFARTLRQALDAEPTTRATAPLLPAEPGAARRRLWMTLGAGFAAVAAGWVAWWALSRPAPLAAPPLAPPPQVRPLPVQPEVVTRVLPALAPVPASAAALAPTPVAQPMPRPAPLPSPAAALAPTPAPKASVPRETSTAASSKPKGDARLVPTPTLKPGNDRRCSDLVQRLQLGDTLQPDEQAYFQRTCRR